MLQYVSETEMINLKNFSQRGEYLWEHWNCLILQDMYLKKMWKFLEEVFVYEYTGMFFMSITNCVQIKRQGVVSLIIFNKASVLQRQMPEKR